MAMRVFVSPGRNEASKFQGVVHAFPDIWIGSVLDIGCRGGNLRSEIPQTITQYYGIDVNPPADLIGNLELGLPFNNQKFDIVVALDVLEHTDNIYKSFNELCRVTKKYAVILLPNAFDITSRLNYIRGKHISGKYGLPIDPPMDRHRWVFSFNEGRRFTHALARGNGFEVRAEGCFIGPWRHYAFGKLLTKQFPSLLSPCYLALLERI